MTTTVNNSTTSTNNPINELIAKVMDKFDTNKDKQLSATEFSSFLGGLISGGAAGMVDANGDGGSGTTNNASTNTPSGGSAPFAPTTANWSLMHGFAAANYYNADMNSMKYKFARIAADYDPQQPGAAERLVADPRFTAAFPNAKLVGKDSIDFGGQMSDGPGKGVPVGIVDIGEAFTDNCCGVAWQWLDEGTPTAQAVRT